MKIKFFGLAMLAPSDGARPPPSRCHGIGSPAGGGHRLNSRRSE